MNVLVACECSQRVCAAFRSKGHEAYSCDIQPSYLSRYGFTVRICNIPFLVALPRRATPYVRFQEVKLCWFDSSAWHHFPINKKNMNES